MVRYRIHVGDRTVVVAPIDGQQVRVHLCDGSGTTVAAAERDGDLAAVTARLQEIATETGVDGVARRLHSEG